MTVHLKIKGRIIRMLDSKTVIINLGKEHGIGYSSMFFILAEPEDVVDPQTNEVLGSVKVTKGRVRASQVFEKFTIATASWTEVTNPLTGIFPEYERTVDSKIMVDARELKPWKGTSETPVRVGDEVEVLVEVDEAEEAESDDEESMDHKAT